MSNPFAHIALPTWGQEERRIDGELPGVRDTIEKIAEQEIKGGRTPEQAYSQARSIAERYHREVVSGATNYPVKR